MSYQEINIAFVEEVGKHEVLYNYKLPGYSRKDNTEKAWQEVAAKVNMTAAECKEKWRNLRTVFMRKLKTHPSGCGKKKQYYLADAMQFCLPFIKSARPSRGNLPPVPQNGPRENEETNSETSSFDESRNIETQQFMFINPESPAGQYEHTNQPPTPSTSNRMNKTSLKVRDKSTSEVDLYVAEYFKTNKLKLDTTPNKEPTASQNIDKKEAIKMFLLSLLPELMDFNDSQIKIFKRRVFNVIDEISTTD